MSKFRWGVVGTGRAASKFCDAVQVVPASSVVAFASRTEKPRADLQRARTRQVFPDYDTMISHASIDAVYVATPATIHRDVVLCAIDRGLPVLCEKPLAIELADVETMLTRARSRRVLLVEAIWNQFTPLIRQIRHRVESNEFGTIRHVSASFGKSLDSSTNHRLFDAALGGGALMDLGIYPIAFAISVLGSAPSDLRPQSWTIKEGVDVDSVIELSFESGATAKISTSISIALPGSAEIEFDNGYLKIPNLLYPDSYRAGKSRSKTQLFEKSLQKNGLEYEIEHFQECVARSLTQSPVVSHADTFRIHDTLHRIRRASGQPQNA